MKEEKQITLELVYEKLLEIESRLDEQNKVITEGINKICDDHVKQQRQLNKL